MSAPQKVLVFGGSFDPPHVGHMNLLQNAVRAVGPQRVLVIPSGGAPHKQPSETPGPLRLQMCACFRPVFPGLELCDMELRRPGRSYTADTLAELRAQNPGSRFYLSVGGDMLRTFTTWRRYRELLAMATLVAQARVGDEQAELERAADALRAEGGQVIMADGPVVPVASSDIRRAVAAGQDIAGLVPPPADELIRTHRLYRKPG